MVDINKEKKAPLLTLDEAVAGIRAADREAAIASGRKWDSLAKPLGSLGVLETAVTRIAGITGNPDVRLARRTLIVVCADNGVVAQGVTQSDASVTAAVAAALGAGTSTASYMAKAAGCRLLPVDTGILDAGSIEGVRSLRVRNGTGDMTTGPAMTRGECIQAVETGISLVREEKEQGTDIILTGEMGIGNTTTATAVSSVLLGMRPEEITGRGAGLSDAGLARKIASIRKSVTVNRPDAGDPADVICKVGGLDIATICGICLGGAFYRLPVLLDGLITCVGALCAVSFCPQAADALLASHVSAEPSAQMILGRLGLKAPIAAGLRLGEGTGALAALSLLDMALSVYNSGHTFGHLGIDAYTPQ